MSGGAALFTNQKFQKMTRQTEKEQIKNTLLIARKMAANILAVDPSNEVAKDALVKAEAHANNVISSIERKEKRRKNDINDAIDLISLMAVIFLMILIH